jgi:hypothetical protein
MVACGLAACSHSDGSSYELLSQDAHGARFRVTCAPSRLEVGVRQRVPLPEESAPGGVDQPFASQVHLLDASGSTTISSSSKSTPIVMWMAEGKAQQIEYIGLQEVDVPFDWWRCRDYVVALEHGDIPAWARGAGGFDPYIRESRRP